MTRNLILSVTSAFLICGIGTATAGPCSTRGHDAGSGSTPGYTGATVGSAPNGTRSDSATHPPTDVMNKAASGKATSSEDAQRQMQGKPTAADQPRDNKRADADQGC